MTLRLRPHPDPRSVVGSRRDLAVLRSITWAGYLETSQIARLHFPSRRVAQRRLRALLDHQMLRAHMQGEALQRPNVYTMTVRGLELLAGIDPEFATRRPARLPRPQKLRHGVAIRDVFVAFAKAEEAHAFDLLDFRFDADLASDAVLRAASLVPDGLAELRSNGCTRMVGIEVDLGTETLATIRSKFSAWGRLLALGVAGVSPRDSRLLVATTTAVRGATLVRVMTEVGLPASNVACFTLVELDTLFGAGRSHELFALPVRAVRIGDGFQPVEIVANRATDGAAFRPLRSL